MPIWLNGTLLDAADARIAPDDRGLLLGDGLFETMRIRHGQVLRLAAHLERLRHGAALLDIPLAYADDALAQAILATVTAAGLVDDASARLTLTRGPAPRGVLPPREPTPTLLITAAPAPAPQPPARVVIARSTRRNAHSPLSRIKSLNYLDGIIARQEAQRRGADDALLLNGAGRLTESTIANLFVVLAGRLVTPPLSEGVLPGVMRGAILACRQATGQAIEERPLTEEALASATEIVLTNSLGLRPVIAVEGHPVGDGAPGPVFTALQRQLAP